MQIIACDVAIIGGELGAAAAALAAVEAGARVVLSDPTAWIGGQITAQGVSALDEHATIETFGGTRAYYRFREGVREDYRQRYPAARAAGAQLNPGDAWAARLSFEPRVGLRVLQAMLAPHVAAGRLQILLEHAPLATEVRQGRLQAVTLAGPRGARVELRAEYFLDASPLGDLLPLAGAPYVTGAESAADTGEPHAAPDGPHPQRVQGFSHAFLLEYRPGEDHTIPKPNGYEHYRQSQPFHLLRREAEGYRRMLMFDGEQPLWSMRRVFDAGLLTPGSFTQGADAPHDQALILWEAADYFKESPIDRSAAQQARVLREARRLALSFLYWLQTEAPPDATGGLQREGHAVAGWRGFPGLRLLPDALGTPDGLAMAPHFRESRRLIGLRRLLEQDITAGPGSAARAVHCADALGIAWQPIDLHRRVAEPPGGLEERAEFASSLPFQLPLGAAISPAVDNLLAAARNISLTHITSAAFRAPPGEWALGEALGALAAFCLGQACRPRQVLETPARLAAYQQTLLERGAPLVWSTDVGLDDPDFVAIQAGLLPAPPPVGSPRRERLNVLPDALLSRLEGAWLLGQLPQARQNGLLADLLQRWGGAPLGPFSGTDWSAACAALDLPAPGWSAYPTLRQVCRVLYRAAR